jgi:hypothetical protein
MLELAVQELNSLISILSKNCLLSEETQEEVGRGLGLIKDASSVNQVCSYDRCLLMSLPINFAGR